MIDPDGFRPNVGIVLMHEDGRVFWARRVHRDGWQFPQGGMNTDETPLEAMYRELREETGLLPDHVEVLGATPGWLRYRLPPRAIRHQERLLCIGQKQVWFLLRFRGSDADLRLDLTDKPEFDRLALGRFLVPDAARGDLQAQRVCAGAGAPGALRPGGGGCIGSAAASRRPRACEASGGSRARASRLSQPRPMHTSH